MRSRYRCSMCPAIHINSRSWLRSSSTHEPSDPPLRVINFSFAVTLPEGIDRRASGISIVYRNSGESNGLPRKLGRSISVDSSNLAKAAAPPDGDRAVAVETGTHSAMSLTQLKNTRAIADCDDALSLETCTRT